MEDVGMAEQVTPREQESAIGEKKLEEKEEKS